MLCKLFFVHYMFRLPQLKMSSEQETKYIVCTETVRYKKGVFIFSIGNKNFGKTGRFRLETNEFTQIHNKQCF